MSNPFKHFATLRDNRYNMVQPNRLTTSWPRANHSLSAPQTEWNFVQNALFRCTLPQCCDCLLAICKFYVTTGNTTCKLPQKKKTFGHLVAVGSHIPLWGVWLWDNRQFFWSDLCSTFGNQSRKHAKKPRTFLHFSRIELQIHTLSPWQGNQVGHPTAIPQTGLHEHHDCGRRSQIHCPRCTYHTADTGVWKCNDLSYWASIVMGERPLTNSILQGAWKFKRPLEIRLAILQCTYQTKSRRPCRGSGKPICFSIFVCATSTSTALNCGGSFNDRKPIGEVSCCDAWVSQRTDGQKVIVALNFSFFFVSLPRSLSLSLLLCVCVSLSLFISLSLWSNYPSIHLSTYLPTYLSI